MQNNIHSRIAKGQERVMARNGQRQGKDVNGHGHWRRFISIWQRGARALMKWAAVNITRKIPTISTTKEG